MEVVHLLGRTSTWFANAQVDQHFAFTRAPLFMQLFDVCMRTFPDALDVHDTGYATVPTYLLAGLIDYGLICMLAGWYQHVTILWTPKSDTSSRLLADPTGTTMQIALLLSFLYRARNLGIGNLREVCDFKAMRWSQVKKLNLLLLMLCPALWYHCTMELIIGMLSLDRDQPWLSTIFWYIMSGSWDVATLRSGMVFFVASGASVQHETQAKDSSWMAWLWPSVKYAAIAGMGASLVEHIPMMAVLAVLTMQHVAQAIRHSTMPWTSRFTALAPVEKYLALDGLVTSKRDFLVSIFVHGSRHAKSYSSSLGLSKQLVLYTESVERLAWSCIRMVELPCHKIARMLCLYYSSYRFSPSKPTADKCRIRLLHVSPSLTGHDTVNGSLAWHNLETAPAYTAISYVWGSGECSASILLDGKEHRTTSSARDALRGLRSCWRQKYFWIDAICIDQDDEQDKAEQISFMSDIYKTAHTVVVWLGPAQHGALALALARRLWIKTRLRSAFAGLPYMAHAPPQAWDSLRILLQHCWFERSWVVQEVLSSNVMVRYGHASIDWITFSMFAMAVDHDAVIQESLWPLISSSGGAKRGSTSQHLSKLKHIRGFEEFRCIDARRGVGEHENVSLLFYLVRMFRAEHKFQVTQVKDRIYALVNLCGLADQAQFKSDYRLPGSRQLTEVDLFTIVAHHLLTTGPEARRLDMLAHAGISNNQGGTSWGQLPSWVPDWSSHGSSYLTLPGQDGWNELLRHPRLNGILAAVAELRSFDEVDYNNRPDYKAELAKLQEKAQKVAGETLYRASASTLPRITIHTQLKPLLELEGVHVDYLEAVGPVFPAPPFTAAYTTTLTDLRNVSRVLLNYADFFLSKPRECCPGARVEDNMTEFGRTLLADLSHPTFDFLSLSACSRPASKRRVEEVCAYLTMHYASAGAEFDLDALISGQDDIPGLQRTLGPQVGAREAQNMFYDAHTHVSMVCAGRAFGMTSRGTMCMLPQGAKVNDVLCLFMGADVPFVIRPGGNEAVSEPRSVDTLIGPAYVQGFMDGEGLTGRPRRSFWLQ